MGITKIKMLSIERFNKTKLKLKGFLALIKQKIQYKGGKLPILVDIIIYTGLFLIGEPLKWFEPYLTEF